MCMEDVRLGRAKGINQVQFDLAAGAQRLAFGASLNRTGLLVSVAGAGDPLIFFGPAATINTPSFFPSLTTRAFYFGVEEFGALLYLPVLCLSGPNATTWRLIEITLEKQ